MRLPLFAALLAASLLATASTAGAAILTGPVTYNGHQYFLLSQDNWTNSEAEAVSMGGHLVTINDVDEHSWVASTFSSFAGPRALWIGFHDTAVEGTYVWVSGQPVTYTAWSMGEPNNNLGSEDWAHIFPPSDIRYSNWNDAPDLPDNFGYVFSGVVELENCGDGVTDVGELCDDGNTIDGDCCSESCTPKPLDDPCDDADLCTDTDLCDGAGACVGTGAPQPLCRAPIAPGKSSFLIKDKTGGRRDRLKWRWSKGSDTPASALGDPTASTGYALCVFDQSASPQPLASIAVSGGGMCPDGSQCWTARTAGYRYRDRARSIDGMQTIILKAGIGGRARALVKAKGELLDLPPLPLSLPATAELRNDAGECWGATYSVPLRSDEFQFKSRGE